MNKQPNLVLIVSDDMGYSDLPKYGDSGINTPNLDRLADQGILFIDGYSTAPICSPSRMGIITGRNQQRFGTYCMYSLPEQFELFRQETTLPQMLRDSGYRTGLIGKWHMGPHGCIDGDDPGHPCEHGFDEYTGIAWGMSSYRPGVALYRGRKEEFEAPEYLTDFFGKEAERFIRKKKDGPFFLMLAFNAVHAPLEAEEEDLAEFEGGEFPGSPDRKTYGAMLRSMDRNVGRVLDALEDNGLEKNTYVGFINDNGGGGNNTPKHTRNTACNAPLRGFKFDLYEGGIRVPMLLKGPGIPRCRSYPGMVSGMDVMPTFLSAAGIDVPEHLDGTDLKPFLRDETGGRPHESLYWCNRRWDGPFQHQKPTDGIHNQAMRRGNWKLVRIGVQWGETSPENEWELYDLSRDIGEQHNVAPEYPEIVKELETEYSTWLSEMHEPLEVQVKETNNE